VLEDAVPDAGDTLNHDVLDDAALAVAVQASVPLPLFAIWIDSAEGVVPPAVYANCRLAGVTAIMDGFGTAAIIAMESVPVAAYTVMVTKPVKVAGSAAVIAVLFHELICKT
jgi:hypothetical protein